jgi:hypothetical protein
VINQDLRDATGLDHNTVIESDKEGMSGKFRPKLGICLRAIQIFKEF